MCWSGDTVGPAIAAGKMIGKSGNRPSKRAAAAWPSHFGYDYVQYCQRWLNLLPANLRLLLRFQQTTPGNRGAAMSHGPRQAKSAPRLAFPPRKPEELAAERQGNSPRKSALLSLRPCQHRYPRQRERHNGQGLHADKSGSRTRPDPTVSVSMTNLPPTGIASRALMHKFMMTCSISVGSTFIGERCEVAILSSTSFPMTRSREIHKSCGRVVQVNQSGLQNLAT